MTDDLNEEITNPEPDPVEPEDEPGESDPTPIEAFIALAEQSTSFSADFLQEVGNLISALGYTLTSGDVYLLAFSAGYVEQDIKNSCNVTEVPKGLEKVAVELIVARFLAAKRNSFTAEDLEAFDASPLLKELSEGDTKQVWDTNSGSSASQRLDLLIALYESGRTQFITYRRLKW